jgi:hypothetical protein
MCWQIGIDLGTEVTAPRAARDALWDQAGPLLATASRDGLLDDATLIVSELIANSIQAVATRIQLDVELHRSQLIVTVLDDAAGWPTPRVATPFAANGRGLAIVEALSHQWGVTPGAATKQVWALLPIGLGGTTGALICTT